MTDDNRRKLEEVSMMLVACAGGARTNAILAINKAKDGDFEGAAKLIEEARGYLKEAGDEHFKALQMEANGELEPTLLLIHAEDQYLSIESVVLLSEKIIEIYKEFRK